jgi:hypothetical protein
MSIRRAAPLLTVALFAMAGCDRLDGMAQQRSDPRLLAGGAVGGTRWSVVQIHDKDYGDCLELRSHGVAVEHTCSASSMLGQHTVEVAVLRGTGQPLIFGLLPAGTARAEVATDGGTALRPMPGRAMAAVEVLTSGELRFVAGPAPAARTGRWADGDTVNVTAYDTGGRPITAR